ncbi:MAG: hypothetical protein Q4B62_05345 [Clostridiaceae bacterium]|nr:hypothetical protein [Clostridiaceae bacterium]
MKEKNKKFYYTYGAHPNFPYPNGWTEVIAQNRSQADLFFRVAHPDIVLGHINCAFVYEESDFPEKMKDNGNFGAGCHETVGIVSEKEDSPLDEIQDQISHKLGRISLAKDLGLISDKEAESRRADVLLAAIAYVAKKEAHRDARQ